MNIWAFPFLSCFNAFFTPNSLFHLCPSVFNYSVLLTKNIVLMPSFLYSSTIKLSKKSSPLSISSLNMFPSWSFTLSNSSPFFSYPNSFLVFPEKKYYSSPFRYDSLYYRTDIMSLSLSLSAVLTTYFFPFSYILHIYHEPETSNENYFVYIYIYIICYS